MQNEPDNRINYAEYAKWLSLWVYIGILFTGFAAMISASYHGRFDAPTEGDRICGVPIYALFSIVVAWINIRRIGARQKCVTQGLRSSGS